MKNYHYSPIVTFLLLSALLLCFELKTYCQAEGQSIDTSFEGLVKVGNHKLFISIRGDQYSKFTVVFESGGGGSSGDWTKVRALLPPEIRTVAYDRASLGKSEKGPYPQTMAQNVFELHELLKAAKIKGPLIMVGQSIGGIIVRLYTEQYGKDVKGLVLVDPTTESSILGSMKYGGYVRLREKAEGKAIPKPQIKQNVTPGYDSTADYLAEEFQKLYLSTLKKPMELGKRPLIILKAGIRQQPPGTSDEMGKQLSRERDSLLQKLTDLSTMSKLIADPKSSHAIHNDNPEIVARSIQMIIHSIISKTAFSDL